MCSLRLLSELSIQVSRVDSRGVIILLFLLISLFVALLFYILKACLSFPSRLLFESRVRCNQCHRTEISFLSIFLFSFFVRAITKEIDTSKIDAHTASDNARATVNIGGD